MAIQKKSFYKKVFKNVSVFVSAITIGMALAVSVSVWATTIGTNITSSGDVTATGSITAQSTTATSTLTGMLDVSGTSVLGDAQADAVGIKAGTFSFVNVATTTIANLTLNAFSIATSSDTNTSVVPMLSFNTSNSRIGVGSTSPGARFAVAGDVLIDGGLGVGAATTTKGALDIIGDVVLGDVSGDRVGVRAGVFGFVNVATTTIARLSAFAFAIATSSDTDGKGPMLSFNTTNSRVGVGSSTPGARFAVAGDALIDGGLGVGAATTSKGVIETAGNITAIRQSATTTLRLRTRGVNSRACIEFFSDDGTFFLIASSAGTAIIQSGSCE